LNQFAHYIHQVYNQCTVINYKLVWSHVIVTGKGKVVPVLN
jgi:hypothetical protein